PAQRAKDLTCTTGELDGRGQDSPPCMLVSVGGLGRRDACCTRECLPSAPGEVPEDQVTGNRRDHKQHNPPKPFPEQQLANSEQASVDRSEEHTSELQSPCNLVCRLLLEKKKKIHYILTTQLAHVSLP